MTFFNPFFFLLLDSPWELVLAAGADWPLEPAEFAAVPVEVLLLEEAFACDVCVDCVAAASEPGTAESVAGPELSCEAAGVFGCESAGAGAGSEVGAGEVAAPPVPVSPGAPLGAAMISTPRPFPAGAPEDDSRDESIGTAGPESDAPAWLSAAGAALRPNEGPAAPGRRTSRAETKSSGGLRFGEPDREA